MLECVCVCEREREREREGEVVNEREMQRGCGVSDRNGKMVCFEMNIDRARESEGWMNG